MERKTSTKRKTLIKEAKEVLKYTQSDLDDKFTEGYNKGAYEQSQSAERELEAKKYIWRAKRDKALNETCLLGIMLGVMSSLLAWHLGVFLSTII